MALKQELIDALEDKFPDVLVDGLEIVRSTGRVTGVIISARFNGLDHNKRQDILWQTLEKTLPKSKLAKIGPIATLTPSEADIPTSARL